MHGLYISIIFSVVGSLFFIGWGLDELVAYSIKDKASETQTTTVYRHFLDGLANEMSSLSSEQLNIKKQAAFNKITQ